MRPKAFRRICVKTTIWSACLVLFSLSAMTAKGQVTEITARVKGKIVVTIATTAILAKGKDLTINYTIRNTGKDTVYFLKIHHLENRVDGDYKITLNPFSFGNHDHTPLDLDFVAIRPAKAIKGTFRVKRLAELCDDCYWELKVGFAFIESIVDLEPKSPPIANDPGAFRGLIASRTFDNVLGTLTVYAQ